MARNTKYRQHENVRKGMASDKIANSSKVATILFKAFLELDGKLRVELCREKKLCMNSGEFYEWRAFLKKKGWLDYESDSNGRLRYYHPGRKLLPYINKEKSQNFELASKDEIRFSEMRTNEKIKSVELEAHNQIEKKYSVLENEHEKMKDRMSKLEAAMDRIINIVDPDTNEAKRKKYLSGGYDDVMKTLQ